MKLLIITQSVDLNNPVLGFFHRWIEEFSKNFEKVIVVCLEKGEYNFPPNVSVFSLGKEKGDSRLQYILNFYRYIYKFRNKYDAVFVHMNQIYVILGGLFWKIFNKKIYLWYAHKNVSFSLRLAILFVSKIFTPNQHSFRLNTSKLNVVGHGIDTDFFSPTKVAQEDGIFKIITVGRISRVKNYEILIRALSILSESKISLSLVGSPIVDDDLIYEASLKELVASLDLNNSIKFLGGLSNKNILPLLQKSNLLVNTSKTGSLDKAVLEAMSVGIPVITSNEAFRDLLSKYDLMCNTDDVKSLSQKIDLIRKDTGRRNVLSTNLRDEIVNNHNIEFLINKIYLTLVNDKR